MSHPHRPPNVTEYRDGVVPQLVVEGTSGATALQADRGHVYVEWVGQPSPFDSLGIQWLMIGNKLPAKVKRTIRELAANGVRRVDGHTRRIIEQRHIEGLSQDWIWGPRAGKPGARESFIQIMPHRDAELIKASEVGDEFRIIGMIEQDPDRIDQQLEKMLLPDTKVTLGTEKMYRDFRNLEKEMGWRR